MTRNLPPIDPLDSRVKCLTCGRALRVSLAECMRYGWPFCCGETMPLQSSPPSESGIFPAFCFED